MGDVSTEPTMEEILSSIKRVIEESEAAPAARKARPARTIAATEAEEVLELSEPAPFPQAPPRERQMAPQRTPADPEPQSYAPQQPQAQAHAAQPRAESILSNDTAEATRGSLEALSRLIVKPEVAGGDTLEGLVREMLRPMLRDWLDTNLPQIVEAMVAREIARISARGEF